MGGSEVSSQIPNLHYSDELKGELFSEGSELIDRLRQSDAETLLQEIGYKINPLACALRNGMARRSDNLRFILENVDNVVQSTQNLMHYLPDELSGTLIAVVKDNVNPFAAAVRQRTLRTEEAETLISQENIKSVPHSESRLPAFGNAMLLSEEFFHQGSQLIGVLPQKYAETILSAIRSAETPLANSIRKKMRRQALDIDSLLRSIDQAIHECQELLSRASPEVLESLLALIFDGTNDFTAMIRARLSDYNPLNLHEAANLRVADNTADSINKDNLAGTTPRSEHSHVETIQNEAQRVVENGGQLINALPSDQALVIMEKIRNINSPLVKAIRLKLSQHKTDLETIISGMENAVKDCANADQAAQPESDYGSTQTQNLALNLESEQAEILQGQDSPQSESQGSTCPRYDEFHNASSDAEHEAVGPQIDFPHMRVSPDSDHQYQYQPQPSTTAHISISPDHSSDTIKLARDSQEPSNLPSDQICDVDKVLTAGRLLLGPLPVESAGAVFSALRSADKALSATVRLQLVKEAAEVAELLALVQVVLNEVGPLVSEMPSHDVDTVVHAFCAPTSRSESSVAPIFRRALALGNWPKEMLPAEEQVSTPKPALLELQDNTVTNSTVTDSAITTVNADDQLFPEPSADAPSPSPKSSAELSGLQAWSPVMPATDNVQECSMVDSTRRPVPDSPVASSVTADVASVGHFVQEFDLVNSISPYTVQTIASGSEMVLDNEGSVHERSVELTERLTGTGASMAETIHAADHACWTTEGDSEELQEGDMLVRKGEMMVKLLGGAEAQAILCHLQRGGSSLPKMLAPSLDTEDSVSIAGRPLPNIPCTDDRLVSVDVTDGEENVAGPTMLPAEICLGEAAGSRGIEISGFEMEQMLLEGGELVLHLPADVADAICALISRARTPVAAGIRGRVAPVTSDSVVDILPHERNEPLPMIPATSLSQAQATGETIGTGACIRDSLCAAPAEFASAATVACEVQLLHKTSDIAVNQNSSKAKIMQLEPGISDIMMGKQEASSLNEPDFSQASPGKGDDSVMKQYTSESMSVTGILHDATPDDTEQTLAALTFYPQGMSAEEQNEDVSCCDLLVPVFTTNVDDLPNVFSNSCSEMQEEQEIIIGKAEGEAVTATVQQQNMRLSETMDFEEEDSLDFAISTVPKPHVASTQNEDQQIRIEQIYPDCEQQPNVPLSHQTETFEYDAAEDSLPPPDPCPKSDVSLVAESWTPELSKLATTDGIGSAIVFSVPFPNICDTVNKNNNTVTSSASTKTDIQSEVVSSKCNRPMHSSIEGLKTAQLPQYSVCFDGLVRTKPIFKGEENSVSKIREALYLVCKRRGIKNANHRMEELLRTAADAESMKLGLLPLSKFAAALLKFGLQVRKYMIRPLRQDISLFENDRLNFNSFLAILNSEQWWPLETDLEANIEELERLCKSLESKFGPKIAKALCVERNFEYLESLLNEAERNDDALKEMRSYVDERLQTTCIEDLPQHQSTEKFVTNVKSKASSLRIVQRKELIPSPYEPSRSAVSNLQMSLRRSQTRAVTLSRLSNNSTPDSQKALSLQRGKIGEREINYHDLPSSNAGYFPALSRKKGIEYSKSSPKPVAENSLLFWQRLPFPMNAVEYKRWNLLKNPVIPGFSDPRIVRMSANDDSWVFPEKIPIKSGSRFRDPISKFSAFEVLDKSGMHKADLKLQCLNQKLMLQGENHLREAKKFVAVGNFESALTSAASALEIFRSTRQNQQTVSESEESADPLKFVSLAIQSDMKKRLKISGLQLERNNFEKALEQIPSLLQGARWLKQMHISRPIYGACAMHDPTEDDLAIQSLTSKIIEAQKASALSVEAVSLASYFFSVREEFEADGTLTTESIDNATKCKNRLPEAIVADGRAYTLVLNAKPADMPAKFQLGTKLKIQGAAILGSGRRDDGHKARYGTVTAFNESSSKYKIQYAEDYEWMSWPGAGNITVEVDIYPEDVEIEIPGFFVHSKTVNLTRSVPRKDSGLIMVVFAVTPRGPPFESSPFGRVCASITGLKSGKTLLDSMESGVVEIIPPSFMLPASSYIIFDALHHQHLDQGVAEFTHVTNKQTFIFSSGQEVSIPQDGVYHVCFKGQTHFDHPSFTFSHRTCIVQNSVHKNFHHNPSKVFLNEPLLQRDEMRIVVSWDAEPLELDLHIYTSSGQHICDQFYDPTSSSGDVRINMDSVTGFGPETATIRVRRHLSYSVSVCLTHRELSKRTKWASCNATVALYDCSGIFSLFHMPPSKHCSKLLDWWHIFSLDGYKWNSAGHGILRINTLMANEMPQMALPGWLLVNSARHGLWDEFRDTLRDIVQKKIRRSNIMIMPRDLANVTSLEGETILGLIALHNEDACEDPSEGNEDGNTPLQNQIESLRVFMRYSERQTETAESLLSRGLPTFETFSRECRRCGDDESFIFRAVAYASVDVAIQILNYLNPVVKQCPPGQGYRGFLESKGERLLMICIEKRNLHSMLIILRCILDIEAVWQRRSTRKFQKQDRVQAEIPIGSGKWLNGVVSKKIHNVFEVRLSKNLEFPWQDQTLVTGEAECDDLVMSDILSSQLRWRSQVIEFLKAKLNQYRERMEGAKEHSSIVTSSSLKQNLQVESVYGEALSLLSEKLLPSLK